MRPLTQFLCPRARPASICAGDRASPTTKPATAAPLALRAQSRKTARRPAMELRAAGNVRLERPCATVPASTPARLVLELVQPARMPAMACASPTTTSPAVALLARYVRCRAALRRRPVTAASAVSCAPPVTTPAAAPAHATTARPDAEPCAPHVRRIPTERQPAWRAPVPSLASPATTSVRLRANA